ncbi:hypothetical protein O7632_08210 [Solwaraspora sp. WMMD406]|uniref:hypothetical protein n=1 Tax=Solwaraspora sp. WMMD406 TaxID=3016095 RepID=UPI0024170933|nr:hypothetical protein [Solwaraspora sp. WMMD406]MDG4764088.1 hypothetical protein [Solwaraspora sp. WMMD406]
MAAGEGGFLLGEDGLVLLFPTFPALIVATESGSPGNFCVFPGYELLRERIGSASAVGPDGGPVALLDFPNARAGIAELSGDHGGGGAVVDCLDGLLDLARQQGETAILDLVNGEDRPLRRMYDYIWGDGDAFVVDAAVTDFELATAWFESQCRVVQPG